MNLTVFWNFYYQYESVVFSLYRELDLYAYTHTHTHTTRDCQQGLDALTPQ